MDTFNDFWSLLPIKDADVYFELKKYLEEPGCETEISRLFKTSTYKFLLANLLEHPYPMCQIIRCFPSSISTQIFYDALQHFDDTPKCQLSEKKSKLYSLLVNACVTDKWLEKCEAYLFSMLLQRMDNDEFNELPFVLVISKLPLIKAYNVYVNRRCELYPYTVRSAFYTAITRKSHFLESITLDGIEIPEPDAIQPISRLLRTIVMISNGNSKAVDCNQYDEICKRFEDDIDPTRLSDNQLILYHEIERILSLYQFVRTNRRYEYQCDSIAIRNFAAKFSILDFFYKFNDGNILMTTIDYQTTRVQLVKNQTLNQLINPQCLANRDKVSEVNVFDQFYAVHLLAEVLQVNQHAKCYEDIIHVKCTEIKQVIDNMFDTLAFVETIESLITLLFLRWEHVNAKTDSNGKLEHFPSMTTMHESDTSAEYNDHDVPQRKLQQVTNSKYGYVCSFTVLQNALNILSSSMANHKVEDRGENLKSRFLRAADEIAKAKWRLSLVDSYYSSLNCMQIPKSLKFLLTPQYIFTIHAKRFSSSGEDEDDAKRNSTIRRKPRRRNSDRRKSVKENTFEQFAHSTEIEGRPTSFDHTNVSSIRNGNHRDRRGGFINKMLGSFTDMVAICISRGDLAEAKRIIEVQKLAESPIAQELQFLEQFQQLKTELKDYLKTSPVYSSEGKIDDDYSVEEIRDLVVHGFESSQILNSLEQFITRNPVQQSREARSLLERFSSNYPYLDLYHGSMVQGTTIIDYIISLSSNSDTCLNIFNMIPQLWDKIEGIDSLQNQLGYYGSFRQIIAALSLYNSTRNQVAGIQDILSKTCYTFNNAELALKLKQEDTFEKLKLVDIRSLSTAPGLKENILNFEIFNRKDENLLNYVFGYSINMNRLINFKNTLRKDIDYTSLQEILEIDLFSLIGDIIFDENANVSLNDIEAIVCNLNTNLLHVITRNTCPIISICDKFVSDRDDELKEILKMISETNDEKSLEKKTQRKPYRIRNREILDYTRQHNSLVAYLLAKIHNVDWTGDEGDELNCTLLENILQMEELEIRTASNEQINKMVAALSFDYFDMKVLRDLVRSKDYLSALQLIQHCQENHYKKHNVLFHQIEDLLITKVLSTKTEKDLEVYSLIEHIGDLKLMTDTLFEHIHKISDDELASHLIRTILLHDQVNELSAVQLERLKKYLSNITLFANIGRVLTHLPPHDSWTKIMEIGRLAPENLLNSLIERNQFELCYEWIQVIPLQPKSLAKQKFTELFMSKISDNRLSKNEYFLKVCKKLLESMVPEMDSKLLLKLRNRKLLQYLVDFLIEKSGQENSIYNNYLITLKIFDVIDAKEVNDLWDLVREPLLVIEQYLINCKFDILPTILGAIRPLIKANKCQMCMNAQQNDSIAELGKNVQLYKQMMGDSLNRCSYVNYKNHVVSIECIDHLLRTYAAKALDFRISNRYENLENSSQPNTMASLDSLCGTFIMPREAPDKANWVKDEEASYCMCCKRSVFTMLTRRHHCRRCGRVVCHSCTTKRLCIRKLYADVPVRVCDDCARQTIEANQEVQAMENATEQVANEIVAEIIELETEDRIWTYRFSTNVKHNNLLREEFSFEYAPSASLCLSILALHTPGQECSNFLFGYCRKFETLLKPLRPGQSNPEVDYMFVTRILYCLSFAAKMHGCDTSSMKVRDHAEIINAVVRNGCESLLPMESINTNSLRTLRDNLVVAEKWSLAIDISLKCGLQKTGIMAAWGIACIKAGCFETAREKFVHCLSRTTCDEDRQLIVDFLRMDDNVVKNQNKAYVFKSNTRPPKTQPLLLEILSILETTCHPLHSDVLHKASIISQSNRSLASLKPRRKENIPIHEPAVNILHTLSNLRQISQGKYTVKTHRTIGLTSALSDNGNTLFASDSEQHGPHSRFYSESIFYLVSYGRHNDILRFLIKYKQIAKALKYTVILHIPTEQFIQTIIMPYLKSGRLNVIVQQMIDMDETLMMWKDYIIQICLMLEKRNLLNSLYQVQLLLKDTVRASMTCVRFYTMNCSSYIDLRNNSYHLMNAQRHLKSELELCQWEEIKAQTKRIEESVSLVMKMDSKSLNQHINTIWLQIDSAKFLGACEENGKDTINLIPKISLLPCTRIPTLFGSTQDKIIITALILICGTNVEEGFGLAYRIIQDLMLNADKIYAIATKYLSTNNRLHDVEKLVDCIKGNSNQPDKKLCDEILSLAVQTAFSTHSGGPQQTKIAIENLIRLIDDVATQIDCHILSGQLKAAYLLAVQNKRIVDIRRILRHAEKTNQLQIKKLCEKKLLAIDAQVDF